MRVLRAVLVEDRRKSLPEKDDVGLAVTAAKLAERDDAGEDRGGRVGYAGGGATEDAGRGAKVAVAFDYLGLADAAENLQAIDVLEGEGFRWGRGSVFESGT